jgi:hypothetical protein
VDRKRLEELVRKSFGFLERDLGFKLGSVDVGQREASAVLLRERVLVRVSFEDGRVTGLGIGQTAAIGETRLVENYGLHTVILSAHPEFDLATLTGAGRSVEQQLERWAQALNQYGAALLRGDFSRRDEFKRHRAKQCRLDNQERWGTATGETPRFEHRPSLPDLFADVTNDGQRWARSYQAVWDYEYSLEAIGAFLGVSVAEVQAMLDEWEGIA